MSRRKAIQVVLAFVCVVCLAILGYRAYDLRVGHADTEQAKEMVNIPATPPPADNSTEETVEEGDPVSRTLAEMDLSALQDVNPDVIGWIYIPDTVVSYPLLIGADNQEYLRHTWLKEYSTMGSIFIECKCQPDLSDFNTIVYGHRMRDQSMFAMLQYYNDKAYWEAHPSVYLVTNTAVSRYDIFASYETGVRAPIYELYVTDPARKAEIIDYSLKNTVLDTGIVPTADDQLLTLSTCPSRGTATRWIAQAVLADVYPRGDAAGGSAETAPAPEAAAA